MKLATTSVILLLSSVSSATISPKSSAPLFEDDEEILDYGKHLSVLLEDPGVLRGGRHLRRTLSQVNHLPSKKKTTGDLLDDSEATKVWEDWNGSYLEEDNVEEEEGETSLDTITSDHASYDESSSDRALSDQDSFGKDYPDAYDQFSLDSPTEKDMSMSMSMSARIDSNNSDESQHRLSRRSNIQPSRPFSRRMSDTFSSFLKHQEIDFISNGYRVSGELDEQLKSSIYNDSAERNMATILYAEKDSQFEILNEMNFMLTGRLLSKFGSDVRSSMYNEMVSDMGTKAFEAHLMKLQGHFIGKKRIELGDRILTDHTLVYMTRDLFKSGDYLHFESIKNSTDAYVSGLLGRGCTFDQEDPENISKIGEFYDMVFFTPRDYVYYPGLIKLASFFVVEFDVSRSDAFFHQFVRSAYSGVYGPRREDLKFITRIEDLPKGINLDESTHSADSGVIGRGTFTNPENIENIMKAFPDVEYKPLNSVPKTLDDVLDATKIILKAFLRKGGMSDSKIVAKVLKMVDSEANIPHLQSFYLDVASVEDCCQLMKLIPLNRYHNHFAAFLYAAYIQFRTFSAEEEAFSLNAISTIMDEMLSLGVSVEALEKTHRASEKVSVKYENRVKSLKRNSKIKKMIFVKNKENND